MVHERCCLGLGQGTHFNDVISITFVLHFQGYRGYLEQRRPTPCPLLLIFEVLPETEKGVVSL